MSMIDEWLTAETATYVSLCRPLSRASDTLSNLEKLLESHQQALKD